MVLRIRVGVGLIIALLLLASGCFGSHPMLEEGEQVGSGPAAPPGGAAGSAAMPPDFHNGSPPPGRTPMGNFFNPGSSAGNPPMLPPIDPGVPSPPDSTAGKIVSEFLSAADGDWLTLIELEWELKPGQETHLCGRATVPRGVYMHEFMPLSPLGTHHSVLSVHDSADAPDGVTSCGPDISGQHIYGAGVGSEPYVLPDGIAMRVEEGQQLLLNLHLFNTSSEPLLGRSGVWVRTMPEAEVQHVAEIVLGGPLQLQIPPGRVTQTGQCTFGGDATIFSVGPHMHQLGVHMRAVAMTQPGEVLLYDGPYAFESQQRYPVDFVQMHAGDAVHVECTYENVTDSTVSFGQSSLDEMCFVSMMRFPAQGGGSYLCTN